jgi:hypothetical protein
MITDQIIKGNLEDFKREYGFENLPEEDAFEHFVNYLVLSRINSQIFEDVDSLENVNIDNGQNFGIDGIALLINNTIVRSEENIDSFKQSSRNYPSLNMNLVFIQAKTSATFNSGDILKFISAVKDFLIDENGKNDNTDIAKLKELKKIMLQYETLKCVDKSISPTLNLFYATTGNEPTDNTLISLITDKQDELKNHFAYFKSIHIQLIDKEHLITYYQENQNQIEVNITFKDKVDLGRIEGIGKAFLGYVSASEFLKLISDNEGNFRRNLFYENVRDFKGEDNKVNKGIADTIQDINRKDKFVIMNNGVTIVAKQIDTNFQGGMIKIVNYQIVNGCQTSNIVYLNRQYIEESDFYIPIKLIECADNDIANDITKATNTQNVVPEDAFIALEHFPKKLQSFFENKSKEAPTKIYYERRSKEYNGVYPKINQFQIFHLHKLIRAIVAVFVEEPHNCVKYYPGELYKNTKNVIFGKERKMFTVNQSPYPYYTSCYIWYELEQLFLRGVLDSKYKPLRFHIQMIIKMLIVRTTIHNFENQREIEKECSQIIQQVWDKEEFAKKAKLACSLIDDVIKNKKGKSYLELSRSADFTVKIKEFIRKNKKYK